MTMALTASLLVVLLNATPTAPPASASTPAKIAEDWAAPPPPSHEAIGSIVRELIAEENQKRADAKERPSLELRGKNQNTLEARFEEATVPGCLRPDGLKRQPTFGVTGVLALPFIMVAKLRGKCN